MAANASCQRGAARWLWLALLAVASLLVGWWLFALGEANGPSPSPIPDAAQAPAVQSPTPAAANADRSVADLSKTASDSVDGTVLDSEGLPVVGAEVTLVPTPPVPSSSLRTQADGTFRFASAPREPLRLLLTHPSHAFANVAVSLAQRSNLRIVLHRRPLVRGRVVDIRTSSPVPEFRAALLPLTEDTPPAMWSVPPDAARIRSDDGAFELRAEQGGKWMLLVATSTFALARIPLQLQVDEVVDQDVRLEPGVVVRGSLRDALGNAVADATVTLATGDQSSGTSATTQEDGTFALPPLPDGDYNLTTLHPELPTLQQFGIQLHWTAAAPLLDLRLPAGASATGAVLGFGAGGQGVVVFQHEAGPVRQTAIDPATGTFSIQGLTPGRHSVGVVHTDPGWRNRIAAALIDTVLAASVDLPAGQTTDLQLSDPVTSMSTLRGQVVGATQPQLSIVAICEDLPLPDRVNGLFRAAADDQGRFELDGLLPARWRIEVWSGDRQLAHDSVEVPASTVLERTITVPR